MPPGEDADKAVRVAFGPGAIDFTPWPGPHVDRDVLTRGIGERESGLRKMQDAVPDLPALKLGLGK